MSDATDQTLAEAFELIEADKLTEAEALLKPILEADENNVDAWWLYAHAVSNPETARMALNQVLRLDESYTEAREMLAELDTHFPVGSQPQTPPPPTELPEIAAETEGREERAFDELEEDEALFNLADDDEPVFGDRETPDAARESAGGSRLPVLLLILLIIVILIIAVLVLVNPFGGGTPTPTSVAQQAATDTSATEAGQVAATDVPSTETQPETSQPTTVSAESATPVEAVLTDAQSTEEAGADPTEAPPTVTQPAATDAAALTTVPVTMSASATPVEIARADDGMVEIVRETLADFELAPDSIGTVQTSLNNTLVAGVCSRSNRAQLAESLEGSLMALASTADSLDADIQAIGIALIDCENDNRVLRVIGVTVEDATRFAANEIAEADFQALWRPIA